MLSCAEPSSVENSAQIPNFGLHWVEYCCACKQSVRGAQSSTGVKSLDTKQLGKIETRWGVMSTIVVALNLWWNKTYQWTILQWTSGWLLGTTNKEISTYLTIPQISNRSFLLSFSKSWNGYYGVVELGPCAYRMYDHKREHFDLQTL